VAERRAYITATSAFLPGPPIENDDMEAVLGMVGGKPSRARKIVLRASGIKRRHYILDRDSGRPLYSNAQITAAAVRGLVHTGFALHDIDCLACGTSLPDQLMPSHGVMVHGELGNPCCEVVATAGICLSGIAALKYAYLAVLAGQVENAVATGSEIASLLMHARNFDAEAEHKAAQLEARPEIAFEKDFLRWMLSDGAGALLVQPRPCGEGLSLRIEWIDAFSYAHEQPVCMYAGADKDAEQRLTGWLTREPSDLQAQSTFAVKQDVKLLNEHVVAYTLERPLASLKHRRALRPESIDYFLPHMSSEFFRRPIAQTLERAGFAIPQERWFTNLAERGNTGSASPFIMLDELFKSGRLRPGERLLLGVPESGRFSSAYVFLTVV
jgi:3-oxoacyl-[acyl-carrier-protein] synthase III